MMQGIGKVGGQGKGKKGGVQGAVALGPQQAAVDHAADVAAYGGAAVEDDETPINYWYIHTAQSLAK
eukprot:7014020-Karenia_brevis.AAC.1